LIKKTVLSAIAAVTLLIAPLQASAAQNEIAVYLDGKRMEFESTPQLVNGSTMVPMRAIFEKLGATVKWDDKTNSVTASKEGMTIKLTIGKKEALKNGEVFNVSVAPEIINNTTYVPLRFVSEALDADVGWINQPKTVTINTSELHKFQITHIRDGDTFEGFYLDGPWEGEKEVIRLIGVDTPETVKEGTAVQYWGPEASQYTKEKLTGKTVLITKDKTDDPYGRALAYVFLENGSMFNADLVSGGYARALAIEPNTKWKYLFSYLEADARREKRGLWSEPSSESSTTSPPFKEYLEEKAAKYGFVDGEFHPEALVTEEQLLKFLIIALFPEAKTIFLAKSFYELSQDEQFQKIVEYAINAGLILKDEIINQNDPITLSSAIKIISRALQLDQVGNDVSLSEFGIYLDQTNANALLTMEDAILLVEKTERVFGPLKEYITHMAEAVKHSETIEKLSLALKDQQLGEKLRTYANNVKGLFTDPELWKTVRTAGSDLLSSLKSLIDGGWKDLINLIKIKDAIEDANESLKEADEALEAAQTVN
jgi:endonuclease YncB( thermonuclease family)